PARGAPALLTRQTRSRTHATLATHGLGKQSKTADGGSCRTRGRSRGGAGAAALAAGVGDRRREPRAGGGGSAGGRRRDRGGAPLTRECSRRGTESGDVAWRGALAREGVRGRGR